jgi:pimeloyl-ACP methyl ester carboxylesterase
MARFVLVHGAFAGGWIWEPLADVLEAAGHRVAAPDLRGLSLGEYVLGLREALDGDAEPAVVVASSMGGVVATQVAAHAPDRFARLIYSAAFVPQDGQSLIDLTRLPEGRDDQTQANLVVEGDPPMAYVPDEIARRTAFACCSDEMAAWALRRRRPQPVAPFGEPVRLDGFRFDTIPLTYVACKRDQSIPPALQQRMLEAAGCTDVVELDTDHVPQLSATSDLAAILLERAG